MQWRAPRVPKNCFCGAGTAVGSGLCELAWLAILNWLFGTFLGDLLGGSSLLLTGYGRFSPDAARIAAVKALP